MRRFGIEPRVDLIGTLDDPNHGMNSECRLRVAAMAPVRDYAEQVGREVEALYLNGPAGGGGVRTAVTDVVGIVSTLVPRELVTPQTEIMETTCAQ